jgi:hypothetical protein
VDKGGAAYLIFNKDGICGNEKKEFQIDLTNY